ncbi:MAG: AraC family ligand binding domain-containing protein, partial [Lachnospiraceae bacterium]|nr:AraC family ligand binding domain-containing protein [Lachnospiraceae bacterium]
MPRKKQTVIEFRNYELSPHFPILLLSGEHWKISDVPSGKLHIHNCLEIGLCLSDSGFMELEGSRRPFKEGDITIISSSVPHTTYSSPGCASQWAYLFADPGELLHPFFSGTDSENPRILSAAEGHLSMILEKEKYPRLYLLIRELIQEMEGAKEYKELAVRG